MIMDKDGASGRRRRRRHQMQVGGVRTRDNGHRNLLAHTTKAAVTGTVVSSQHTVVHNRVDIVAGRPSLRGVVLHKVLRMGKAKATIMVHLSKSDTLAMTPSRWWLSNRLSNHGEGSE